MPNFLAGSTTCRLRGAFAAVVLAVLVMLTPSVFAQSIPAFPGAYGYGADTPGGRGGDVLFVTNLNDSGPGSLRAAVEASGPRIVVFRVAGVIELESRLTIRNPHITIAGQSAPGSGITLANHPLVIKSVHVVVRHLRVRPGDRAGEEMDAVWVNNSSHVVLDHLSTSWGIDETLSVTQSNDVTVQWSFITESLNDSHHSKGEHGYGSLIGHEGGITFHHNLYAHHRSRNPRPQAGTTGPGLDLDFRNNVIYDFRDRAGYTMGREKMRINYVGNYVKPGPSTKSGLAGYAFMIENNSATYDAEETVRLFVTDNMVEGFPEKDDDNASMIAFAFENDLVDSPFPMPEIPTDGAETALQRVLDEAGATLPVRDAVDARVVEQVRSGTGGIIDSQTDVGGWPEHDAGEVPEDADEDGMPDEWETAYGLNPNDPSDGPADLDGDGYTNIEEYLNATNPTNVSAPSDEVPRTVRLAQNYPNPFNPVTTITYDVALPGPHRLVVLDVLGREVAVLADGQHATGTYEVRFDANALPAGLYLYSLRGNGQVQTRKMTLLK